MTQITDSDLAGSVSKALAGWEKLLPAIAPVQYTQASQLPGWDRAHVLAHVDGFARAMARQLSSARTGELVPMYDGGQAGRNERIELAALMAPEALRARVTEALGLLATGLHAIPAGGWAAETGFRPGSVVRDCVFAAWRELVIHATDLGLGHTPLDWSSDFCAHLFDALAGRIPADKRVVFQPTGGTPFTLGSGLEAVVVTGMEYDLAAWLAGRTPVGPVRATADADGADLPELLPWAAGPGKK
ncbi:maleylpyruvate isomerase family mycothiol-dependent enzyme [Paeniglutamicibacter cryotolerans]|uniref:Maleylpyruvate isomerase n=1 Tax=Paeniglutamicibacter cryotolerans TaxID=670079 RepID=A0A839QSM1_9MICC|nr:maleylpyruvate isomerase family mycothiol-dependent enzyme [Paeniglutamicibacter cryotolerans]MBB2996262.1 maleylpyruvate isomerase [Paeniglutamicibacter cryotolerans]